MTYDSGDYRQAMDARLALPTGTASPSAAAKRKRRGKLRGIGLANYIEATSGAPRECAQITVAPEGRVDVVIGTLSSGQGHETSFAQCVAEWLGVPFEAIRLIQGDTDMVPVGGGSHSGRSMRMASIVMGKASDAIIAKGNADRRPCAGGRCSRHRIRRRALHRRGTDRSIGLFEVAARGAHAQRSARRPARTARAPKATR